MIILRVVKNIVVMALEIALIVGCAYLGYQFPIYFAVLTVVISLWLGLRMEFARLKHEYPFYFDMVLPGSTIFLRFVSLIDTLVKALLAGVMALLTFSGTDHERLLWIAIIFGVVVFAGSSLLRRLSISLNAHPSRWGYFRLAAPLGLLYSLALTFLPKLSFADIGYKVIFDLPKNPDVAQVSEVLFVLKQKFDALIEGVLAGYMHADVAKVVSALVSVNVLSGFVIALFAVMVAEVIRFLETRVG